MSSNKPIPQKKKKNFSIHFDILLKTTCTRPKKKSLIACTSVCNEASSLYYFLVSSKIYCFKILLQKKVLQNSNGHLSTTKGPPKFSTKKEKEKKPNLWAWSKGPLKLPITYIFIGPMGILSYFSMYHLPKTALLVFIVQQIYDDTIAEFHFHLWKVQN